jgi:LysR family hydrogen peroxide-inducible transcriptional activator
MKQLQYLSALAEHRHFGLAAESCFVTQSTLSAGIRELEDLLQAQVAERTNRSVMITPLGRRLTEMARELILGAEDMIELARSTTAPLTGPMRLGVIPTIGPYLLPAALPGLQRSYPKLELFLREDYSDRLLEQLRDGSLDLLLLALPYEMEGVETEVLFEDGFMLACPSGHELAQAKSVSTSAFADEPLLLLEEGHCLRRHSLEACSLEGRFKRKNFEATSMPTLVQMVSIGMGLTLLPQIAIDAGVTKGLDITLVPLSDSITARQIGLVWRKTSPRGEEFRLLGEIITAAHRRKTGRTGLRKAG